MYYYLFIIITFTFFTRELGGSEQNSENAWSMLSDSLYNESHAKFSELLGTTKENNELSIRFGYALSLLGSEPRLQGNIETALASFKDLSESYPNTDIGIASLYYMARIYHIHSSPFNWSEAKRLYKLIIDQHPNHFFGQLALCEYALLQLYEPVSIEARIERYNELSKLEGNMDIDPIKSHYHYEVADALLRFDILKEKAVYHYLNAIQAGIVSGRVRSDAYVSLAETAYECGKISLAIKYYKKLIQEFPRDHRIALINDRLKKIFE